MMAGGNAALPPDQIYQHKDHPTELQTQLHYQWISRSNCDLNLCCNKGSTLPVHACVIACFSPKVCSHLSNSLSKKASNSKPILRVHFDMDIVTELVSFMYCGLLRVSCSNAKQMLECAEWLGIAAAVGFVKDFIQSSGIVKPGRPRKGMPKKVSVHSAQEHDHGSRLPDGRLLEVSSATETDINVMGTVFEAGCSVKQEAIETDITCESLAFASAAALGQEMLFPAIGTLCEVSEIETVSNCKEPDEVCVPVKVEMPEETQRTPNCIFLASEKTSQSEGKTDEISVINSSIASSTDCMTALAGLCIPAGNEMRLATEEGITELTEQPSEMSQHPCKSCREVFPSKIKMYSHMRSVHWIVSCEECSAQFSRTSSLTKHIQKYHKTPVEWKCRHCGQVFSVRRAFEAHSRKTHGDMRPHPCDASGCDAMFSTMYALQCHKDAMHTKLRTVCKKCGKQYTPEGYRAHIKTCINTGQYLCQECGIVFNLSAALKQHIVAVHRKEARYFCSKCGKRFSHSRNLYRHMLIHDNAFPYPCKQCVQKFRHSNSLKSHTEKKHTNMQEECENL